MQKELLQIKGLKTHFFTGDVPVKAVDGVDLVVDKGQTLGIVGESGSGKSVTSLSIMRLIANPPGKIVAGEIIFEGRDLLKISDNEMREIRGNEISMIFQDPMTALNPSFTVGDQIAETIKLHQNCDKKQALEKAVEMLTLVGIPEPRERVKQYPHEFSGGMRQRAMIAMGLSCNPKLLIADEPTTALDVTVQAQILKLMKKLQQEFNTAIIMITHDLGVVAETCDFVAVMYAGKCVEYTDVYSLFEKPLHPYTLGLLNSQPKLDRIERDKLNPIKGNPPNLRSLKPGCSFAPRCTYAKDICHKDKPELQEVKKGHKVACHFWETLANTQQGVN
ncbi:oligopeptide transport system ATP-binding protein [Desulfonispora thiosulfatigenes DSM 11270]|uniref:Oligopeptide transport system ATP-binding protein n=1 Tax=Desulfonispora thiosulfatigenes DSM 11270 TaxID=656914 RepID=A0A1W1ULF6_DESTI|nr:ABC transporter ATP-binding protein [Desulfonispora thiosulfatigenes]SMB81574.1 oligopeptide transport system ATP-binding protein [Desulfonispora thiosulfatigenes DSM 11270]